MSGMKMPEGQSMATVKVGEKGQIVIPKVVRDLFSIQPGDTLLLMADIDRGIAIVKPEMYLEFINTILKKEPENPEG